MRPTMLAVFIALALAVIAGAQATRADGLAPQAAPHAPRTLSGSWTVRRDSIVGYRTREALISVGSPYDVVGRTSVVTGLIRMTKTALTAAAVSADMRTLTSDNGERDSDLNTRFFDAYPKAVFTLSQAIPLTGIKPGQVRAVSAVGTLEIHGVTKEATFAVKLRYNGATFQIVGSARLKLTDFGIDPPSKAGLSTVEDGFKIEVRPMAPSST
jgi:polyisoprenoid-binding protein YceI